MAAAHPRQLRADHRPARCGPLPRVGPLHDLGRHGCRPAARADRRVRPHPDPLLRPPARGHRPGVRRPPAGRPARGHPARAREAVRNRPEVRSGAEQAHRAAGARGAGVPDRSLPRHVDGAEHPRPALRQPVLRVGVEQRPHRARRDRVRRAARARRARRLLRPRRRAEGHAAEPPARSARAGGHGAAAAAERGRTPIQRRSGAARDPRLGRRSGGLEPPGPLHRGAGGRSLAAVVRRRTGRRPCAEDRDARAGDGRDRHRALAGRAVRAALRQGARARRPPRSGCACVRCRRSPASGARPRRTRSCSTSSPGRWSWA